METQYDQKDAQFLLDNYSGLTGDYLAERLYKFVCVNDLHPVSAGNLQV